MNNFHGLGISYNRIILQNANEKFSSFSFSSKPATPVAVRLTPGYPLVQHAVLSYPGLVAGSVGGGRAVSDRRARGIHALNGLQGAHFSVSARARVAGVGAVVYPRGTEGVVQAFLSS